MAGKIYIYERPNHQTLMDMLSQYIQVELNYSVYHTGVLTYVGQEYITISMVDEKEPWDLEIAIDNILRISYREDCIDECDFETANTSVGMNHDKFKELLEELDGNSLATLAEKNARYSSNGDALHNFRSGADIMGGTPAQACWGYLTKHLTALRDMVQRDDFSNREDFLEKCQDTINYVRFLWCIGNDTEEQCKTVNELIKEKEM